MARRLPKGVRGGDRLRALLAERIPEIASMRVTVGVQAREGAVADDAKDGQQPSPGVTVLDKAVWNEFGTTDDEEGIVVPARPFLRSALDENRAKWTAATRKAAKEALLEEITVAVAANRVGNVMRGDVQQQIKRTTSPPNAPYTIKRKGSSHPLIDTGQLRQSIRYLATIGDREVGSG